MHPYVIQQFDLIIDLTLGVLVGWIASDIKTLILKRLEKNGNDKRKEEAHDESSKIYLRSVICEGYTKHCVNGEPLTALQRSELERAYNAYRVFGGNGTGRHMWDEIAKLPIVTD